MTLNTILWLIPVYRFPLIEQYGDGLYVSSELVNWIMLMCIYWYLIRSRHNTTFRLIGSKPNWWVLYRLRPWFSPKISLLGYIDLSLLFATFYIALQWCWGPDLDLPWFWEGAINWYRRWKEIKSAAPVNIIVPRKHFVCVVFGLIASSYYFLTCDNISRKRMWLNVVNIFALAVIASISATQVDALPWLLIWFIVNFELYVWFWATNGSKKIKKSYILWFANGSFLWAASAIVVICLLWVLI